MHDCFGKPIKPFDRVRAATKEELEAQGHPEASYPAILSPAEQLALPATFQSETCNVHCVPGVTTNVRQSTPGGPAEIVFTADAWPTVCTARALVKLEG